MSGDYMAGPSFVGGYISALVRAEPYSQARYAHCFPTGTPAGNYLAVAAAGGGAENLADMASRILFTSVGWCRGIPFFNELNASDQWYLVRNSWADLFLLSAAQFGVQLNSSQLLAAVNLQSQYASADRLPQIYTGCSAFLDRVEKLRALHLDSAEYSCLKAITLYSAGKT